MHNNHPVSKVAVIGAGTMGTQIALLLSLYRYDIVLVDASSEALRRSLSKMKEDIRMMRLFPDDMPEIDDRWSQRIKVSTGLEDAAGAQLIIENITEDMAAKERLYRELRQYTASCAVYAVNTSCIPITAIASILPDPSKVVGCHFMNPVYFKRITEMIRTPATGDETLSLMSAFLKSIRMRPVAVADAPGFVANRLSHLLMNEAAFVIDQQLCSATDLDLIFKMGYGHAMGPLETADLIGIDTVVDSLRVLERHYEGDKFRCCPLLLEMVDKGRLGRKSGKGFYDYK